MARVESLRAGCAQVEQVLDDLRLDCEGFISRLDIFDAYVTNCMGLALMWKLGILLLYIAAWRQVLQEHHGGKGEIAVFVSSHQGITVQWVEDPRVVADRDFFTQYGFTVMPCEEAFVLILRKMNDALSGNWMPALEWFRTYGRSRGLDIAGEMRMAGWPW